ncbi:MAG: c-type cytochrome [Anaerolineales bacterium]|nr:c-type cytochrome [Anaerolineales bacterium]
MRRYIPTLLVAFGLLAAGAIAIVLWQSGAEGPNSGSQTLLVILAGVAGALVVVVLLGWLFGLAVGALAQALSDEKPVKQTPPAVAAPPTAPAPKKAGTPPAFLYDTGSLVTFWAVIGVLVAGFLTLRAVAAGTPPGYPLDRLPDWSETLFELPGLNLPITQLIGLGLVVAAALGGVVVVGIVLAKLLALLSRQVMTAEAANKPAEKPRAAGPAAKPAAGEKPQAFLYDTRSVTIFFGVLVVFVAGFLGLRSWAAGTPLGFTPFERLANVELFDLPGDPIAGWPAAIVPGPGNPVLAWQGALFVITAVVVGVAVVGVGLARLLERFSATEKALATAPPAWPSQQLTALEARVKGAAGQPLPRLTGLDQVIVLLFVVILGLLLVWVVPGISLVSSADKAVEATQIAASWTPTPSPGPVITLAEQLAKLPAGDAAAGEAAVTTRGCVACHIAPDPSVTLVGPAWQAGQSKDGKGVSDHAAARWEEGNYTGRAKSAQEYLYESITNPAAFIVPGYQPAMPGNYAQLLEPQELADIIAYLAAYK